VIPEHPRPPSPPSERRRHRRHEVSLGAVVLADRQRAAKGLAVDLSLRGARLSAVGIDLGTRDWTPAPLDPEARIWLSVECPGVPLPISLRARIVWRKGDSMGVAFVSPPEHTVSRLAHVIAEVSESA
jgi:hypothetical protein